MTTLLSTTFLSHDYFTVHRGVMYTYRYTVNTRMTPALSWAAMRDILIFD